VQRQRVQPLLTTIEGMSCFVGVDCLAQRGMHMAMVHILQVTVVVIVVIVVVVLVVVVVVVVVLVVVLVLVLVLVFGRRVRVVFVVVVFTALVVVVGPTIAGQVFSSPPLSAQPPSMLSQQ
jgi:hypothetical protein